MGCSIDLASSAGAAAVSSLLGGAVSPDWAGVVVDDIWRGACEASETCVPMNEKAPNG